MHRPVDPAILYFGTPVVLVSTLNEDGSPNLAPMSSAWLVAFSSALPPPWGGVGLLTVRSGRALSGPETPADLGPSFL